jgi:hypothetical protein
MRPPAAEAAAPPRSAWTLGLTIGCIALFSAMVLAQTAVDRAALRAEAAGPAGAVPPPETGHLRRHKRGGR